MAEAAEALDEFKIPRPDVSHLVTEDDEPVEDWFQEAQQVLLPDILHASWALAGQERPFLAVADVGLFYSVSHPAVVPDAMVSLDVTPPDDWWEDHNRSYFIWEFGKAPEIVVEVVSNPKGGEQEKMATYARAGVAFYAIFDPRLYLSRRPLRVYALHAGRYVDVVDPSKLEGMDLGFTLWEGTYKGITATWLRWCDARGNLLPTGLERAQQEHQRAEQERERAEQERERAEQERERADQERERAVRAEEQMALLKAELEALRRSGGQ